jgi:hypothetical protein
VRRVAARPCGPVYRASSSRLVAKGLSVATPPPGSVFLAPRLQADAVALLDDAVDSPQVRRAHRTHNGGGGVGRGAVLAAVVAVGLRMPARAAAVAPADRRGRAEHYGEPQAAVGVVLTQEVRDRLYAVAQDRGLPVAAFVTGAVRVVLPALIADATATAGGDPEAARRLDAFVRAIPADRRRTPRR